MRKAFIVSILLMFPLIANAQKNKTISLPSALDYNDFIVDLVDSMDNYWTLAIEEEDMKKSLKFASQLKKASTYVITTLNKLEGFNGDTEFKNAAIAYAQHFQKISSKDLPAFIKIIRKKGELTVDDEKKAEAYLPELDDKREYLFDQVQIAQYAFADQTGLDIEGREKPIYDYVEMSNFTDASDYHNYLVDLVDIIDNYWTLAIEVENKETALAYCDTMRSRTEKILGSLDRLGSFKGYDDMRLKVKDYAMHMNGIAKKELKEFLIIIRSDEMTADDEKRAESLLPVLDDKREELYKAIEKEQNIMAAKFDFTIVK